MVVIYRIVTIDDNMGSGVGLHIISVWANNDNTSTVSGEICWKIKKIYKTIWTVITPHFTWL